MNTKKSLQEQSTAYLRIQEERLHHEAAKVYEAELRLQDYQDSLKSLQSAKEKILNGSAEAI